MSKKEPKITKPAKRANKDKNTTNSQKMFWAFFYTALRLWLRQAKPEEKYNSDQ